MRSYSETEKSLIESVNAIGLRLVSQSESDLIFLELAPFFNPLMALLKSLSGEEIGALFIKYKGVANVMRLVENEAQHFENLLQF